MATKAKTRILKVQLVGGGLPFVKVSVADIGLRRGDFVEVARERGTLRLKKTKPPAPKPKGLKPKAKPKAKAETPALKPPKPPKNAKANAQRVAFLALTEGVAAVARLSQDQGFTAKTFDSAVALLANYPEVAKNLTGLRADFFD